VSTSNSMQRAAVFGLALLAAAASLPAQAGELYRYKDPFGVWRTMTVAKGMAKHYQRAQVRASGNYRLARSCDLCTLGGASYALGGPAYTMARLEALRGHRGLIDLDAVITQAALDTGVDRALLSAVIAVESGFRVDARSPKGALGLMQLMPATAAMLMPAADVGSLLTNPALNVDAGSRHLRRLIDRYPGRLDLALAAYNAGEGAVSKYSAVPPYAETQQYVRDVMALYAWYHADS
jgi:soluble lytic murein transglycosylase-like protein